MEKAYIDGKWIAAQAKETFQVLNPATQEVIAEVADCSNADVQAAIAAAKKAFAIWSDVNVQERSSCLKHWAELIRENIKDLAILLTSEQGKPLIQAETEIAAAADHIEWAAEQAKRVFGYIAPQFDTELHNYVIKRPIGVVAAITPWNYPIATITHKIGAAIAAGCTVILKPSKETPLSALALAKLAHEAGLKSGVLNVVPSSAAATIAQELLQDSEVRKLSFTGSTTTGKLLMQQAAQNVTKLGLEMGGNAPFIVFDDADFEYAINDAIARKFTNAGQVCVAANRFLIQETIYADFVEAFNAAMDKIKVGDGKDADVTMGPLINTEAVNKVHKLVKSAKKDGAKIVRGGKPHDLGAAFFEPTLITDVKPEMGISCREIFGPVAAIQEFTSEDEALHLANNTHYGLAAYCYTRNLARIYRFAHKLEFGSIGINTYHFGNDTTPFGGVKQSGIGREGGVHDVDEYCETKTIGLFSGKS